MYVPALGTFLALSSYAPGGRHFPEFTCDDRILPSIFISLMTSQGHVCACLWNLPGTFFLRPDGVLAFYLIGLLLAGRWCLRLLWLGYIH